MIVGALSPQYVAGFFDGEGCIYVGYGKAGRPCCDEAQWSIRVSATNTYRPILEAIQRQYGGNILAATRMSSNCRQAWIWQVFAKTAGKFLTEVTPFLVQKRARAEAALFFCDTYTWPKAWRSLTKEAKELRRLAIMSLQQHPNIRGVL